MNEYFLNVVSPEDAARTRRLSTMCELETLCLNDYAELTAVVTDDAQITYQQLWDDVARIRGGLLAAGLTRGEVVAVAMPNNLNAIESFLAIITAGGVAAMLPGAMSGAALVGPCRLLGAKRIITHHADAPVPVLNPDELRKSEPAPAADMKPAEIAAAFFTGGTSGKPKAAMLCHRAIMTGVYNGIFAPNGSYQQRYYALLPFSHVFGTIRNMLTCFQTGSTLRTCTDMTRLVADLQSFRPTILVLVPALVDMLLGLAKKFGLGVIGGCVKTIIAGAAPVPTHVGREFAKLGVTVCPGYGLTETSNLVSGNGDMVERPESVGKLYPNQEIRFENGEIWLRGEHLFSGYINDPAETAAAFTDGWFRTGDLGYMDEDGYLYITGRIKNIIVLANGEKISPEELERLVDEIPLVKGSLVKMAPNQFGAEVLTCEVLPVPDADVEEVRRLIEGVNATLPAATQIQQITFRTTDFKRTPAMKIVRNQ